MSTIREAMEKFISIGDEIAIESMDFEAAEEGARDYMFWSAIRPILRSYPALLERIDEMQKTLAVIQDQSERREAEIINKPNVSLGLLDTRV